MEFAVSRPQTLRANSMTMVCMPRQMPKYGNLLLAREPDGVDHALYTAFTESAGNQNTVEALEPRFALRPDQLLGFDPVDVHLDVVGSPPCSSDSFRLLYESSYSTYLPTSPIST